MSGVAGLRGASPEAGPPATCCPGSPSPRALAERGRTVHYVGAARGVEADLVPAAGVEHTLLPGRGIQRRFTFANVAAVVGHPPRRR